MSAQKKKGILSNGEFCLGSIFSVKPKTSRRFGWFLKGGVGFSVLGIAITLCVAVNLLISNGLYIGFFFFSMSFVLSIFEAIVSVAYKERVIT